MTLGIVGSRKLSFSECQEVISLVINLLAPELVVSGGARGVDSHAVQVARSAGVPIAVFYPLNLEQAGKAAFFIRNRRIARSADILLCLYAGSSPSGGTAYTHQFAAKLGKIIIPVFFNKEVFHGQLSFAF